MQPPRFIPIITVVHVCPPIMVQTDSASFQSVVQELTGKRKSPTCETPQNDHSGDDDNCELIAASTQSDQSESTPPSTSKVRHPPSDREASADEQAYTRNTYCCHDLEEATRTRADSKNHADLVKRLKLEGSKSSANSNYSNTRCCHEVEDLTSPVAIYNMEELIWEMFFDELMPELGPAPPVYSPVSSSMVLPDGCRSGNMADDDFFDSDCFLWS